MAIEWLAGNRLRGTTAERPALGLPSGSVGGWVELGRTTFGGGAKTYEVASLANKRYLMVLVNNFQSAQVEGDSLRFNNDTTANQHAGRYNNNGGSDGSITNKTKTNMFGFHPHSQPSFAVMNVANLSSKEKLAIIHAVCHSSNVSGAGNPPDRSEMVAKYINTSNPISSIQQVNVWNNYDSGSEMVVLGYDPDDTHTTNFWEEIGTATGTGVEDVTASASKKYNWIQGWVNPTSGSTSMNFQLGNGSLDTGSNYSWRYSLNGAGDITNNSQSSCILYGNGANTDIHLFYNIFFINNSANEKLIMIHNVYYDTAGAGSAPIRFEIVGKWSNTSAQANHAGIVFSAGNAASNSELKWWGSD